MKKYIILSVISVILISCEKNKTDCSTDDSEKILTDKLYNDLKDTYIRYTDSVSMTSDSITQQKYSFLLEDEIYKIYKRYPAGLDYKLTEDQNDSLWHYIKRYNGQRLMRMVSENQDTSHIDEIDTLNYLKYKK